MKRVTLDVANIEKIPNIAFSYFLYGLGTQGSTCAHVLWKKDTGIKSCMKLRKMLIFFQVHDI